MQLNVHVQGGYIYSRLGNPTCEAVEAALNALEGGAGSLTFPSGMSAITTTLLCFLKAGDHMVRQHTCDQKHTLIMKF